MRRRWARRSTQVFLYDGIIDSLLRDFAILSYSGLFIISEVDAVKTLF